MALIGTIRKNGWILIVAMALALGGFILMDVMSNSQRYSAADVNSLGKVGDVEIKRNEFDTYEKLVYSEQQRNNTYQIRNQAWTYFLEKAIVEQEVEPMGLGVGKEELLDLQFGLNLSPIILERFKNDAGQPDRAQLAGIKNAIEQGQFSDQRARAYWAVQEKEIVKTRLQEKLINAVSKGMYTPKWQAELVFQENNYRRDFAAVRIQYDAIKDDEIKITDGDYEDFISENPKLYTQQEETRIISFATFPVIPTQQDSAAAVESVSKLKEGLRTAKNDSTYVLANGGAYSGLYVPKNQFPATFADSAMNKPIGSVVGPIFNDGEYQIMKIIDRKSLPDSVKARHILLRDATPENSNRADSLLILLRSGKERFDSLAMKLSQDPASGRDGGNLGWFANGSMVKEFNDLCFLTGEQGKLYKISTQFGWHIVEITGKKFETGDLSAKVAVLGRRLEPSKTTQQAVKDRAVALIQQAKSIAELESLANQNRAQFYATQNLKQNDFNISSLGAGDDVREVIRWVFDENTKTGNISKEVFAFSDPKGGYFDAKYVIPALKGILAKGKANVATLKAIPEAEAYVKAKKKAEVIKGKIQNASDLAAIASQWNSRVDTLKAQNFLNTNGEPRVFGTVFALETGKVSKPIMANMGVVFLQPLTDIAQQPMPADMTLFRRQMSSQAVGGMRTSLMKSLQRQYEVQDNRFRFW
ncbi:MAG: peptidylprolyl isomerase [Saprospiraceae bacterium]|nr:peptidylprolyl isomerase [Saprospiraceae bacterium]